MDHKDGHGHRFFQDALLTNDRVGSADLGRKLTNQRPEMSYEPMRVQTRLISGAIDQSGRYG